MLALPGCLPTLVTARVFAYVGHCQGVCLRWSLPGCLPTLVTARVFAYVGHCQGVCLRWSLPRCLPTLVTARVFAYVGHCPALFVILSGSFTSQIDINYCDSLIHKGYTLPNVESQVLTPNLLSLQ